MVRTLFFLLSLLVPALCSAQESKATSNATICFYRAHRYEGAALKPSVYVDEIEIARLKNGQSVQVIIPPGVHKAYSNDKSTGIDLEAKPGQTYYVRVEIKTGAWKGHGAVTLVDPQEGKYEFSKEKLELTRDLTSGQAAPPTKDTAPPSTPAATAAPTSPSSK